MLNNGLVNVFFKLSLFSVAELFSVMSIMFLVFEL